MRAFPLLFTCFAFLILSSCATETTQEKVLTLEEVLPGDWHLIEAKRNKKPTTTLQGVYFNFDTLGKVTTNFTGAELNTDYKQNPDGFSFVFENKEMNYVAQILDKDTLNIQTKVRIFDFDLTIVRGNKQN